MRKFITLTLLLMLMGNAFAQTKQLKKPVKKQPEPTKGFYLGTGCGLSSVNIFRNYRQSPYRLGYFGRLFYEKNDYLRFDLEYNFTPKFDLDKSWKNMKSYTTDANLQLMAQMKDESMMFYTISGMYFQRLQGFFTGEYDFNNSANLYTANTTVTHQYLGLNLGLGFEKNFSEGFQVFGEFRYRFAKTELGFGIMDAAYHIGIKKRLPLEKIFRLVGKYTWF